MYNFLNLYTYIRRGDSLKACRDELLKGQSLPPLKLRLGRGLPLPLPHALGSDNRN